MWVEGIKSLEFLGSLSEYTTTAGSKISAREIHCSAPIHSLSGALETNQDRVEYLCVG